MVLDQLPEAASNFVNAASTNLSELFPFFLVVIFILLVLFLFYKILSLIIFRALKVVAAEKDQQLFMSIWSFLYYFIAFSFLFLAFSGSFTGLGIGIGLFTAALGWALQKPITGIAAWLLIIFRKPFKIGDRVIIGGKKGDIVDLNLFYIVLNEVGGGGTLEGEERSQRRILIPNYKVFDEDIVNYSLVSNLVLDSVEVLITYESNLKQAKKILLDTAESITQKFIFNTQTTPYVRASFKDSGVLLSLKYLVTVELKSQIKSMITEEIFEKINKRKDVEIAYPHLEVVYKGQTKRRRSACEAESKAGEAESLM